MAAYVPFPLSIILWIIFSLSFEIGNSEAPSPSTLKIKKTEENYRSKHMVKFHHAKPGEFPYALSLQIFNTENKPVHVCGATLLNVLNVMLAVTSATCLDDNDPDGITPLTLVAGVVQSNRTKYQQRRSVCSKVIHEDFLNNSMNPGHPRPNDLALLFIDHNEPFKFGFEINVYPIELPTSKEQRVEEPLTAFGWEVATTGYYMGHVFETPSLTRTECFDDHFSRTKPDCRDGFQLSHICAANEEPFEGGTHSRGSPILSETRRYLAGIWSESYARGSSVCGRHPTPAIFTSMPYHRDWIYRQVESYNKLYRQDEDNPKFHCK